MTSSTPLPQEQWFELSFVVDQHLERVALRSTSPNALDEITAEVERATKGYIPPNDDSIKSFSVISLERELISGTATSLLETLSRASGGIDDSSPRESQEAWKKLQGLAEKIDQQSRGFPSSLTYVEVGFVWDNGGSEDNAFEDGFCCVIASKTQEKLLHEFLESLEGWGNDECIWYDYYHVKNPSQAPQDGRMSFEDFRSWVSENEDFLPPFMAGLVDDVGRHEMIIQMDQTLAPPSVRSPRTSNRF